MSNVKRVEKGRARDRVAGGIGIAAAVVLFWLLAEFTDTNAPDYVVSAAGGVIVYVITKIEEILQ